MQNAQLKIKESWTDFLASTYHRQDEVYNLRVGKLLPAETKSLTTFWKYERIQNL